MQYPSTPICIPSVGSERFLGRFYFQVLASQVYNTTTEVVRICSVWETRRDGERSLKWIMTSISCLLHAAEHCRHMSLALTTSCYFEAILDTGLARQSIWCGENSNMALKNKNPITFSAYVNWLYRFLSTFPFHLVYQAWVSKPSGTNQQASLTHWPTRGLEPKSFLIM